MVGGRLLPRFKMVGVFDIFLFALLNDDFFLDFEIL